MSTAQCVFVKVAATASVRLKVGMQPRWLAQDQTAATTPDGVSCTFALLGGRVNFFVFYACS
jgi:hypothetical protein